jgi:hypothetical protein
VELSTNSTSLGIVSIKVDGVGPQLNDEAGSPLCDLVGHSTGFGMPGHTTRGTVVPTPGFSGATGLGTVGLLLPGLPGSPPLLVDWGLVEDSADYAYLYVTVVERLL